MFDKLLFDRNAFDRSVSSDEGIISSIVMTGQGLIETKLTVRTPFNPNILRGTGLFTPGLQMRTEIGIPLSGAGGFQSAAIVLRRSTQIPLAGQGAFFPQIHVKVPIKANLSGSSQLAIDNRVFFRQHMSGYLSGNSALSLGSVFSTTIVSHMSGVGAMVPKVGLGLPLSATLSGGGILTLRRLGALSENVIELIDIDFLPGETITIDTDLLQVLFGSVEDVSAITRESVFFELNPGENEIVIETDSDSPMQITAIWQNRWL